jgi:hypothetical protein
MVKEVDTSLGCGHDLASKAGAARLTQVEASLFQ